MDTTFSNRNFTKKYADNSQKKGGKLYRLMQLRSSRTLPRPAPAPSVHATMRAKGLKGPAKGTKAYKKLIARAVSLAKRTGKKGNR